MATPQVPDARARSSKLDAPTVQAVVDLRRALRSVKALERADTKHMSPTQKGIHDRKLETERFDLRQARVALEQILEDE